jgi:DNA uptake protein ComE-like DNA-binding protein
MIDINSGTVDQLKTLVGIGAFYARRIVKGRPYQRMDELVSKAIIPYRTYDRIRNRILVRSQ